MVQSVVKEKFCEKLTKKFKVGLRTCQIRIFTADVAQLGYSL
jgi:hypothetical protein